MKQKAKKLSVLAALLLVGSPLYAAEGGTLDFVARIINFLVFFGGLFYLVKKPIGDFFINRLTDIKESLALAEKSREEAKKRLDEIEAKSANLDKELDEIGEQAKQEAERERTRIHNQAKMEADRILEQARLEVENMKRESISKLKANLADQAIKEAETLIKDTMTGDERQRLFGDFNKRLEARS